jgi:formylglycine-generating enzyme required for sulfatase activity
MGASPNDALADADEKPQHKVNIRSFYIGKTEVTLEEWKVFCVRTGRIVPAAAKMIGKEKFPITNISRLEAEAYCKWLSKELGQKFRLPTEAEWEYAAKGATLQEPFLYAGSPNYDEVAWYFRNASLNPHAVATKKNNTAQLYDMSGNVWEWCSDTYDKTYYKYGPKDNPKGQVKGNLGVLRGGSYLSHAPDLRLTDRLEFMPSHTQNDFGFRIARD